MKINLATYDSIELTIENYKELIGCRVIYNDGICVRCGRIIEYVNLKDQVYEYTDEEDEFGFTVEPEGETTFKISNFVEEKNIIMVLGQKHHFVVI